jgi:hypothetical protein
MHSVTVKNGNLPVTDFDLPLAAMWQLSDVEFGRLMLESPTTSGKWKLHWGITQYSGQSPIIRGLFI